MRRSLGRRVVWQALPDDTGPTAWGKGARRCLVAKLSFPSGGGYVRRPPKVCVPKVWPQPLLLPVVGQKVVGSPPTTVGWLPTAVRCHQPPSAYKLTTVYNCEKFGNVLPWATAPFILRKA